MNMLDQLRDQMIGKRYYKIDPEQFVVVLDICKTSRGYYVLFRFDDDQITSDTYSKFVKNYSNEVKL